MGEWLAWACAAAVVVALDQAFQWLERRGWIYWRGGVVMKTETVALMSCPDCAYRVSPRALACPACGRLVRPWRLAALALAVALLAVSLWRMAEALPRLIGS